MRYHFLRDLSNERTIDLVYYRSEDQIADIMTKPLKLDAFKNLCDMLGMCSFKSLEQEKLIAVAGFVMVDNDKLL